MMACTCGYHVETEEEFLSHVLERHRLSFGLENCCIWESSAAADRLPEAEPLRAVDFSWRL